MKEKGNESSSSSLVIVSRRMLIAGIAAKEGRELWRGEECGCHTIAGLARTSSNRCQDNSCTK